MRMTPIPGHAEMGPPRSDPRGRRRPRPRRPARCRPVVEGLEGRRLLATVSADFNHDGAADLAVGAPGEDNDAGAVTVIYGSSLGGLTAGGKLTPANQVWTQDSPGVPDVAEAGDQFGRALAAGDFNGDGFADLAVGAPFEDRSGLENVGGVTVLYGSGAGLTGSGSQYWDQDSPDVKQANDAGQNFGAALAAGDFNGDGRADLAVGVPGEGLTVAQGGLLSAGPDKGVVNVLYGAVAGLTAIGNQGWAQDGFLVGLIGQIEDHDEFGAAIAAGDFNGDGFDDLAIGVPGEDLNLVGTAQGGINVVYGSPIGLDAPPEGGQFWSQESPGIVDAAEGGDRFAAALAAGDFNGDGFDDLAVGIPFEDLAAATDAGAVAVIFGGAGGLSATSNQFWTQDTPGIDDAIEAGDQFGSALAAGDFNGDGRDDLAIGVPREDLGPVTDAGAVHVLYGGAVVLAAAGSQLLRQGAGGVEDAAEAADRYGFALGSADYNGDGRADLAVGVPGENGAGAVNVLYGTAAGFTAANDQLWTQDSPGIPGGSDSGDGFGGALAGSSGIGAAGFSGAWARLGPRRLPGGDLLRGVLNVQNPGTEVASRSVVRFFLSADATLSNDDRLVATRRLGPLAPQQSVAIRFQARLRKRQTATGTFVLAVLDANNDVREINERNNLVVFGTIRRRLARARR